jgi:hypothetical protein
MNKIFEAMLRDDMQTWVLSAPEGGAQVVYAVLTTSVLVDPASNSRNLVIYSLSGYKTITKALYEEGVEGLKEYAKAKGCTSIIAYTSVPAVERIAMVLGAERAAVLRWRVQ